MIARVYLFSIEHFFAVTSLKAIKASLVSIKYGGTD